ncbi:MAG: carbon storage regulator [Planctomycetia bacterium]|nr:carbon storage regulator [Planctomycetia bacterium]
MLVLSRKVGERIVVGGKVVITLVRMGQGSVRIGIDAPSDMAIVREELMAPADQPAAVDVELCDVAAE